MRFKSFSIILILLFPSCYAQLLAIKPARTITFTTNEGSYMSVDISPDGNTLLFDLLGDIYSIPSKGGMAKQLTRGIAINLKPIWSPDGKYYSFISDNSGEFHVTVSSIDKSFNNIIGKSDGQISVSLSPQWTRDSKYIAFNNGHYDLNGNNIEQSFKIENPLLFSKDNKDIYFIEGDVLYCFNTETEIKKKNFRIRKHSVSCNVIRCELVSLSCRL